MSCAKRIRYHHGSIPYEENKNVKDVNQYPVTIVKLQGVGLQGVLSQNYRSIETNYCFPI